MLDSALNILKHFAAPSILRRNFGYFEIIRTDVKEVFYLCEIGGNWFLVFETDFIMNLQRTYNEAAELFEKDFIIDGWIAVDTPDSIIGPSHSSLDEEKLISRIAFTHPSTQLRYCVLKVTSREPITLFSPTAYGNTRT